MKRFGNLTVGGIGTKIFVLILVTVVLVSGAFMLISVNRSGNLTRQTAETSARQQETPSAITADTMSLITRTTMERTTGMEAAITDEMFRDILSRVLLVSDYATKIFADPAAFPARPYAGPDASLDGRMAAQVLWADGLDPDDPALAERTGLLANLSEMMISLCEATGTDNVYVGTEEGIFLSVNRSSADWFLEDGSLKSYDPRTRFWYRQALEAGGPVFSDLEVDATTGELSVVCAVPVYGPDGKPAAVVGSDLFLHAMEDVVAGLVSDGGYSWIVNRSGHVIYSPNPEVLRVSSSADAADLRESGNRELAALVSDAMTERTDVRIVSVQGEPFYMLGAPIPTVGWTLFSAFSKEAVDQVEASLLASYAGITEEARGSYQDMIRKTSHSSMILLCLIALASAAGAIVLGRRIVKPLNTITKRISQLSESNLEFRMEDAFRTGDEVEELARSFAAISHKTVEYLDTVRRVTAEKERIGTELSLATQIQAAMLPHIVPAFPDRKDFDIVGSMDPAKEVGGDFYDYFLIDSDHLCMVVADVSGKGVPAALFMMASKIILQSVAMLGGSPAEILTKTNEAICSSNEAEMFVTVWTGILELSTGRLTCANAGHEYPVFTRSDGSFELYRDPHGVVLGAMEGMRYTEYELTLRPGTKLFVYTDGVPEATNAGRELFGTKRMVDALNGDPDASPEEVLKNVRQAVDRFVLDAEQFDDLTMLCLLYKGPDAAREA